MHFLISGWSARKKIQKLLESDDRGLAHPPLKLQAELLNISRSSCYHLPSPVNPKTLAIKNQIDEIYTKCPFYGTRKLAKQLSIIRNEPINRKRVQRYMREMGIAGISPTHKTTLPNRQHKVFPYLLSGIPASFANHIWSTDITYIRMNQGFVYLTVFLDWFSRFILSHAISTSMEGGFVIAAGKQALDKYGHPVYTNSDQGSQMTSQDYICIWDQKKTKISMDGRGRCLDNVFVERLWRTVKYEEVYLKSYQSVAQATASLDAYIEFYNYERIHQALGYKTPASVYFNERNTP